MREMIIPIGKEWAALIFMSGGKQDVVLGSRERMRVKFFGV
jgi:hypothetical protein